jgi:hypothetical protein
MPNDFDTVLPTGRSCGSYRIGHIKSVGATVVIPTPAAIQASLPRNPDLPVVWSKPEWHVVSFSARGRGLFSLAALDERTLCHPGARQAPGESTADFVARAIREDHGYTVPLRSLLAPDVVEGKE